MGDMSGTSLCVSPQLCGRSIPSSLHSSGSVLSFRLHTSRGYSGGYDLTYTSSEAGPGCGGEVGGTRGVVTSPGYPGVTNTSSDCWWVVRVPQGQRIQLRSVNDHGTSGLSMQCQGGRASISTARRPEAVMETTWRLWMD